MYGVYRPLRVQRACVGRCLNIESFSPLVSSRNHIFILNSVLNDISNFVLLKISYFRLAETREVLTAPEGEEGSYQRAGQYNPYPAEHRWKPLQHHRHQTKRLTHQHSTNQTY